MTNDKNYHTAMDAEAIELRFANILKYYLAKDRFTASDRDRYVSLALVIRERIIERWIETQQNYHYQNAKRAYYLSLEYMMGRSLLNNIINMEMTDACSKTLEKLGYNLEEMAEQEVDAGLGNGGLGRLASCFLDSMATLGIPAIGYGLRYDYGIFRQDIKDGYQVEEPDEWLRYRNIWEIERPEYTFLVQFEGNVEERHHNGKLQTTWHPLSTVLGVPYDMPVIGYGNDNVNTLRLWSAKASSDFGFADFNQGDYIEAVKYKIQAENLTKVLYPNDTTYSGRELRFRQQYFFVSCSLQDIIRRFQADNKDDFSKFPDKVSIQLNDTHPAIAIAELMRLFVDVYNIPWEAAWKITTQTMGYTNHTLLPEALEKWPLEFFKNMLPRHLQIIYEINRRFLDKVSMRYPGDNERLRRMSLIEEGNERQIRMAYLAVVGSHSVNGVAKLHTELLKKNLLKEFYEFFPERFNNKTNGITQRRWLLKANQYLAKWIIEKIGKKWITNLDQLHKLEPYINDEKACEDFVKIKRINKEKLVKLIAKETGVKVSADAIFDVQIKRMHEYKRQLLNILHVVMLYNRLKKNPKLDVVPRVFIFSGKAAPGYFISKLIIKLITSVGDKINQDEEIFDKLKVIFLPNYRVSLAEKIIPAADVSEQISTAGFEASGTGNMKLSLNGALTIGTLDGANIEIQEEVGKENIFIFGLKAEEIEDMRSRGAYHPMDYYNNDPELKEVLDLIFNNFFCLHTPGIFEPLRKVLFTEGDRFFVLADFKAYAECQAKVEELYRNQKEWSRKAILNVARMGKFSTDRVIREYAEEIWRVNPIPIDISHRKGGETMAQAHRDVEKK